jgi:hypothetical protein
MNLETIGAIIATVDAHAGDMNRRWGFNRLPHIVPIEWTERFVAQKRKWQTACFECVGSLLPRDVERVRMHGEAMIRAFQKLDEIALAAGAPPAPPGGWEFELRDGRPIVLVRTRAELSQIKRDPPAQTWCLEEIGEIISRFPELCAAKHEFPEAEILQLRTSAPAIDELNDSLADIPW